MNISPNKQLALETIQRKLNYSFQNQQWLHQALTHRSFSAQHNERFEFIGDSILNYTIAKMLFDAFPHLPEGKLSRLRANLVNQDVLAQIAVELKIGDALFLGQGELKSGGFNRPSILADALEALFAAISFDANFSEAEKVVRHLFKQRIKTIDLNNQNKDAKSLLQETLQAHRLALPKYRIEEQKGEGNTAEFLIACDLGELGKITYSRANSRRAAEQAAAKEALDWLLMQLPNKKK